MSSDSEPTRPVPRWQPAPDSQPTQRIPRNQSGRGYQGGGQGYYPADQGYPANQGYAGNQGYQETQRYSSAQRYDAPPPRRRRRHRKWPWVLLVVIIVVLVGGDRVACALAENDMANQIQQQGFPAKPHVTIEGFPFLTQVAARDLNDVQISASNVTEGPLVIQSLNATARGVHINSSFNGATVDSINGSALITFAALARAGGIPQGITLSADGSNQVKASINLSVISASVVAQVTKSGANSFNVRVVSAGDVPTSVLGNLADFTITVPKSALPAGLSVQSVSVTQQGILVTAVGHNTTLSE